jgi:hypothetical protein
MTLHPATPGVFEEVASPPPPPAVVRDDIAAFVGLCERGPLDRALRLERVEDYALHFGHRDDAFQTPDAVEAFFLNGGRTCYVVRVAHRTDGPSEQAAAAARADCLAVQALHPDASPVHLEWVASQLGQLDPGTWADQLGCALRFTTRELGAPGVTAGGLVLQFDPSTPLLGLQPGALLWFAAGGGQFAFVASTALVAPPLAPPVFEATLASPLVVPPGAHAALVEARLDALAVDGRRELYDGLGLDPRHARYLPSVLRAESYLVNLVADGGAPDQSLFPVQLRPQEGEEAPGDAQAIAELAGGVDGLRDFVRDDYFPPVYSDDEHDTADQFGLGQLPLLSDVSLVVLPDLVLPGLPPPVVAPPPPPPAPTNRKARFVCAPPLPAPAVPPPAPAPRFPSPPALIDPAVPVSGLPGAVRAQDLVLAERRLVAYCELAGDRVALLSPAPSIDPAHAEAWRHNHDSAFAAGYYPWLKFGDPVIRPPVRTVTPVGVAAGIIARAENRFGVGRSPANLKGESVLGTARVVSKDDWARLHQSDLDVFRPLPGDVRLLGGRTLSSDRPFRYLHVRRLLTHIERLLARRLVWAVFEPNTPATWTRIKHDVESHLLLPLFRRGAFAGDTPQTSYYVRCDEMTNPRDQQAIGRLVCEIGVAPNLPAEFIVFRLAATREIGITVEEET